MAKIGDVPSISTMSTIAPATRSSSPRKANNASGAGRVRNSAATSRSESGFAVPDAREPKTHNASRPKRPSSASITRAIDGSASTCHRRIPRLNQGCEPPGSKSLALGHDGTWLRFQYFRRLTRDEGGEGRSPVAADAFAEIGAWEGERTEGLVELLARSKRGIGCRVRPGHN